MPPHTQTLTLCSAFRSNVQRERILLTRSAQKNKIPQAIFSLHFGFLFFFIFCVRRTECFISVSMEACVRLSNRNAERKRREITYYGILYMTQSWFRIMIYFQPFGNGVYMKYDTFITFGMLKYAQPTQLTWSAQIYDNICVFDVTKNSQKIQSTSRQKKNDDNKTDWQKYVRDVCQHSGNF